MERQTRISRLVGQFLRNRFSAQTEERVQRWLVDPRDAEEKEAASLEFWNQLDAKPELSAHRSWKRVAARAGLPSRGGAQTGARPMPLRRPFLRRTAGVAASIVISLVAVAGGLIYYAEVRERDAEEQVAAQRAAAEAAANEPLAFEGASVREIFTALEERFGVTFTADESFFQNPERYTVKFPRGDSLDNILNVLADVIGAFEYTRTDNHISITNQ
jgi:hypothetical protein